MISNKIEGGAKNAEFWSRSFDDFSELNNNLLRSHGHGPRHFIFEDQRASSLLLEEAAEHVVQDLGLPHPMALYQVQLLHSTSTVGLKRMKLWPSMSWSPNSIPIRPDWSTRRQNCVQGTYLGVKKTRRNDGKGSPIIAGCSSIISLGLVVLLGYHINCIERVS